MALQHVYALITTMYARCCQIATVSRVCWLICVL